MSQSARLCIEAAFGEARRDGLFRWWLGSRGASDFRLSRFRSAFPAANRVDAIPRLN